MDEQQLADQKRARIEAVDPANCSELLRCPHCNRAICKPRNLYEPGSIESMTLYMCTPRLTHMEPTTFNCYYCNSDIDKLEVFEGKYDVSRSDLSRKELKILDQEESSCIKCSRDRLIDRVGSYCFGGKEHVFHRPNSGFQVGDASFFESLRLRLQPGWIPERWEGEFDLVRSIYFRRPPAWYPSSPYGQDVCFLAGDSKFDLQFKLCSVELKDGEGLGDFMKSTKKRVMENCETEPEFERTASIPSASDSVWPRFVNERPQFKMAGMKRCRPVRWMRFRYNAPGPWIQDVYTMLNEQHGVSVHFGYPTRSEAALKPLIRRMVGTIRVGATPNLMNQGY